MMRRRVMPTDVSPEVFKISPAIEGFFGYLPSTTIAFFEDNFKSGIRKCSEAHYRLIP
jgi:hypothetical protein